MNNKNYPKILIPHEWETILDDYLDKGIEVLHDIGYFGCLTEFFDNKDDEKKIELVACYRLIDREFNPFLFLNVAHALHDLKYENDAKDLLIWMTRQNFNFMNYFDEPTYLLGRISLELSDWYDAIIYFKLCAEKHIDDAKEIGFFNGYALHRIGMFDAAIEYYHNYIDYLTTNNIRDDFKPRLLAFQLKSLAISKSNNLTVELNRAVMEIVHLS